MRFLTKIENQTQIRASLLISPANWKLPKILDNEDKNNKLYLQLKKSSRLKQLHSWENDKFELVERGQKIALLNNNKHRIEYFVQYEFDHFRGIKTITQIAVWANKGFPLPAINGLSAIKWTFFKYLLPKATAIAADSLQTEDGKAFWMKRIGESWDLGYITYMVLRDKNTIIKVTSLTDLYTLEQQIWGTKRHHEFRRAFISENEIFPKALSVDDYITLDTRLP